MTLENLLAIQRLQPFEPTAEGVRRLLAAAAECLARADALLAAAESMNWSTY